ncbi:MAG: hypothetical protein LBP87_01240, partial [Planctomycetaceae bacterium]|nr:hypothetical protein [Planctomycetaceae bacterium]
MKFPIVHIPIIFFVFSIFSMDSMNFQLSGQEERLYSGVLPQNPEIFEGVQAAMKGENEVAEKLFTEAMKKQPGSRPGGVNA